MPWLGVADTNVTPAGNRSVTCTPVAAAGPPLVRVTVKVIWSPTLGVASLTVLVRARSACCGSTSAVSVLLPVLGSNWSASVMVAVLVPKPALATVAVIASVAGVAAVTVPTVQTPVTLS